MREAVRRTTLMATTPLSLLWNFITSSFNRKQYAVSARSRQDPSVNLFALPMVVEANRIRPKQKNAQPPTCTRWIVSGYMGDCHMLLLPPSTLKDLSQEPASSVVALSKFK